MLVPPLVLIMACAGFAAISKAVPMVDTSISNNTHLQERQFASAAADTMMDLGKIVAAAVKNAINKDKMARGDFTLQVVNKGRKEHPAFNWVACHTKHRTKWKGTNTGPHPDWGHRHEEFDVKLGGTVGYEIYWAKEGEFWNDGDGGFLNWAYAGKSKTDPKSSHHVIFSKP